MCRQLCRKLSSIISRGQNQITVCETIILWIRITDHCML